MQFNKMSLIAATTAAAGLAACGSKSKKDESPVVAVKIDPEVDEKLFGSWFLVSVPLTDKETGKPVPGYNAKLSLTLTRDAIIAKNVITEAESVVCSVEAVTRNFTIEKRRIIFNEDRVAEAKGKGDFTCNVDIKKGVSEYKIESEDKVIFTSTKNDESSAATRLSP